MEEKKTEKGLNRRSFIKGAVIGAGALALSGTETNALPMGEEPEKWDLETDVLILGAGGTGLVAALEAAEKGASVVILEKAPVVGGTTALAGGVIQASGTDTQKEGGITDTPEAHYQYWIQASEGYADEELVKLMADNATENLKWLMSHGLRYGQALGVSSIPYIDNDLMVDRVHVLTTPGEKLKMGTGGAHIAVLYRAAKKAGVRILLETPGNTLIYKKGVGVIGVQAKKGSKDVYVKAKRCVILSTGGYDHNTEMARAFSPQQLWALQHGKCMTAPSNTGDGMRLAMALGADLEGLGGTIGAPSHWVGAASLNQSIPAVPGIWVNCYGRRFVNEGAHYAYAMRAVFNQEQHTAWAIFDEDARSMGGKLIGGWWTRVSDDLKKEIEDGKIKTGANLTDLSKSAGIDPGQLTASVEKWNRDVSKNKDTVFNKKCGLKPISTSPFYAVRIMERNLGSCGGLKIDSNAQVIDVNGEPIPRLFAGGMVAGGFIGPYYPGSGTAYAATVCFGRIAGKHAAKLKSWS